MIKLNTDKSAAANQSLTWLSIDDHPPPVGAKLLLINRSNGPPSAGFCMFCAKTATKNRRKAGLLFLAKPG